MYYVDDNWTNHLSATNDGFQLPQSAPLEGEASAVKGSATITRQLD
jgi:hypothetical protein